MASLWTLVKGFSLLTLLASQVSSKPVNSRLGQRRAELPGNCTQPLVRKEWRTLTLTQRSDYIKAVKCVMAKPAITSKTLLPGVTSFYEDYVGTHILRMEQIHFVGVFFAWHRWFIHLWEQEMHACGYSGGQPYWDWQLDVASKNGLSKSPVFDPETGFGGNGKLVPLNMSSFPFFGPPGGFMPPPAAPLPDTATTASSASPTSSATPGSNPFPGFSPPPGGFPPMNMSAMSRTGGGCILSGPFANLTVHIGPMSNVAATTRCVTRDFNDQNLFSSGNQAAIDLIMNQTSFESMRLLAEFSVHGAGHGGVGGMGGDMMDPYASPSDPVFYLHHANMDRVWWSWQSRNLTSRLSEISGPLHAMDFGNLLGGNATLDTVLDYASIAPSVKVRDTMDIRASNLCYTYDTLY